MSLANPTALVLLALALPIALLYLVRVRPRELSVSTDQFWEQVFAERAYRSAWQKLRDVASLLVQLALLGLLAFALAAPFWNSDAIEGRRVVLVLDQSASMSALDGSPTRFDAAKREASRAIAELRSVDEAALVVAGSERRVTCGLTSDRRVLSRALDAVGPSECPTNLGEAVDLARLLLAKHPRGLVEVFTDGCGEGTSALLEAKDVAVDPVGRRTANVAITRFQARRSLNDLAGFQVFVEVANFSDVKINCRLDLERDGLIADVFPLSLEPGETWRKVVDKASTEGGRLMARLDHPDAFPLDNRAWAIVPPRDPVPVRLVEPSDRLDDVYLEKVLEANPMVRLLDSIASDREAGEVRVYHHKVPTRLPPGPAIVIDPAGPCDLWDLGEPIRDLLVGSQDRTSPLLTFVKLENVVLERGMGIRPLARARVLASFVNGEPLLATFERPEGKVVVLTASLDDPADLPLRTAFPILMGNALTWLDGRRSDRQESARAGSVVELSGVPSGSKSWSPDGEERPCSSVRDALAVGPLDRCGVWRVASKREGVAFAELACNLASPSESDLRPPKGLRPAPPRGVFASRTIGAPWFALIVAAFGVAVVEWRLYQRRWLG